MANTANTAKTAKTAKTQHKLSGIIEVDELFMAYSEKGSKKLTRELKARKRGGDADKQQRMIKLRYYFHLIAVNI